MAEYLVISFEFLRARDMQAERMRVMMTMEIHCMTDMSRTQSMRYATNVPVTSEERYSYQVVACTEASDYNPYLIGLADITPYE